MNMEMSYWESSDKHSKASEESAKTGSGKSVEPLRNCTNTSPYPGCQGRRPSEC